MISIALVNESTKVSDDDVRRCMAALQAQVVEDFYPVYGTMVLLGFLPKGAPLPAGYWELVFADNSDQAGALGYHEVTANGEPIGYVFVESDLQAGTSWTVTASHELLEMLGDPDIQEVEEQDNADGSITMRAHELCDACEDDSLAYQKKQSNGSSYTLSDGSQILLSDFVFPSYWNQNAPSGTKFDQCGHITKPLQILLGGYMGVLTVPAGVQWQQIMAEAHLSGTRLVPGGKPIVKLNRRQRRQMPDSTWRRSTR